MFFTKKSRRLFHKKSNSFSIAFIFWNHKKARAHIFIWYYTMREMSLINPIDICQRKICLDNVRAVFTENMDG